MKESSKTPRPSVSLEQLLHVKRAERPEASFWEDFDRELRRRQLAAVVAARPWHVRFFRGALQGLRRTAPFAGAAAALALALALHNSRQPEQTSTFTTAAVSDDTRENVVMLPEQQFLNIRADSPSVENRFESTNLDVRPRFAVLELTSSVSESRSFTTVTSPMSFAAAAGENGMYVINDLTTGPVMRAPALPVGNL